MIKDRLKRTWYLLFSEHPYTYLGSCLVKILPASYIRRFYYGLFPGKPPSGFLGNIITRELCRQYYLKSEDETRRLNREKFWGAGPGKEWHSFIKKIYTDKDKFNKEFLTHRDLLIANISKLLSTVPNYYHTICDIGTGNGLLLDYLSKEFNNVKKFVGVDLNKEQILENKETYKDSKLEFVHVDITDWINTQSKDGIIFIACGAFEYFTQEELKELFQLIRERVSHAAITMCEPINLDLKSEMISRPRGGIAYSHNYPHLLKQCGYHIVHLQIDPIDSRIPFYSLVNLAATM
jgi:SAM-dependent methyltransferase